MVNSEVNIRALAALGESYSLAKEGLRSKLETMECRTSPDALSW